MRGLYKATGYYNTLQAKEDWRALEQQAIAAGLADIAQELRPLDNAGWRTIDKQIARLRTYIRQVDKYCECANPIHLIKPHNLWLCDKCNLPTE